MKIMKIASIITGVIFALFAILLLVQMWGNVMPWETFMKIAVTAAVIIVVTFGLALLYREYMEEKSMKEDKYLD
jgi:negative regulator of sigma E activity